MEDYPHFLKNTDTLISLLNTLRKTRGNHKVDEWQYMITSGEIDKFVRNILECHYDVVYRKPGDEDSRYHLPVKVISLNDHTAASYVEAVTLL